MKKMLVIAALLAVMLPLAAAEKDGRWFVDLTWNYDQPAGLDTIYAYAYGYGALNGNTYVVNTKTFDTNTPRAWSPEVRVGYETDAWKAWMSYYKFKKVGFSGAEVPAGYQVLFNTLAAPSDGLFGDDGFVYGDTATARQNLRNVRWEVNAGRKFKPSEKWQLFFYGGLSYFKVSNDIRVIYGDTFDYNNWGPGSTDEVRLQSNSSGYGIQGGLISSIYIGSRFTISGGIELGLTHAKRNNTQSEFVWSTLYSPYYGALGTWRASHSTSKVLPTAKIFVETEVKLSEHFYGKVGYKFRTIKDAFSYTKLTNDYPFGAFGYVEQTKDVGFDGGYFTIGFKF